MLKVYKKLNYEKKNTCNIWYLDDYSFVPLARQTSLSYCRLTDGLCWVEQRQRTLLIRNQNLFKKFNRFVPLARQTSVLYCRLTDVLCWVEQRQRTLLIRIQNLFKKFNKLYFVIQFLQIETFESIAFSPVSPIEMNSFFCHISQYGGLSLRCHRVTDLRKDLQM